MSFPRKEIRTKIKEKENVELLEILAQQCNLKKFQCVFRKFHEKYSAERLSGNLIMLNQNNV